MQPQPKTAHAPLPKDGPAVAKLMRERRQQSEKAQRDRVREIERPDIGRQPQADLGPGIAIERGQVVVNPDAAVPVNPDEKNGPLRIGPQARRVWAPDRLRASGMIGAHQHQAAEDYLDDFERGVEGARDRPMAIIARGTSNNEGGPSDARLHALGRYRRATKAVGQECSGILAWCVLRHTPNQSHRPTVEGFAAYMDWPTARAMGLLIGALGALAAFYGHAPPERATIAPSRRPPAPGDKQHRRQPTPPKHNA